MLKRDNLIRSVLDGIINANDFYEKITLGDWLSDAGVESVLQTKIAENIYDSFPKDKNDNLSKYRIILEHRIDNIVRRSRLNPILGKIPNFMSGAKRVDILICDRDRSPLVPIEVKRNAAALSFSEDAERILKIIRKSEADAGGSVMFGLICGFIFGKGDTEFESLQELIEKKKTSWDRLESIMDLKRNNFIYKQDSPRKFYYDDDERKETWWVGGAVCVYLR